MSEFRRSFRLCRVEIVAARDCESGPEAGTSGPVERTLEVISQNAADLNPAHLRLRQRRQVSLAARKAAEQPRRVHRVHAISEVHANVARLRRRFRLALGGQCDVGAVGGDVENADIELGARDRRAQRHRQVEALADRHRVHEHDVDAEGGLLRVVDRGGRDGREPAEEHGIGNRRGARDGGVAAHAPDADARAEVPRKAIPAGDVEHEAGAHVLVDFEAAGFAEAGEGSVAAKGSALRLTAQRDADKGTGVGLRRQRLCAHRRGAAHE